VEELLFDREIIENICQNLLPSELGRVYHKSARELSIIQASVTAFSGVDDKKKPFIAHSS